MSSIMNIADMKRKIIHYDDNEEHIIKLQRSRLTIDVEIKIRQRKSQIYQNQRDCAKLICEAFSDRTIIGCLVVGKCQSGKTGTMVAFIEKFIHKILIPIENIFIISCLSCKEWKSQTTERMPDCFSKRIYHRDDLDEFVKQVKGKKNVLIINDEIHIAGKIDQSIDKKFKECGFRDLNYLLENDIKIVEFSATPDGHLNDFDRWEDHSRIIKMEAGDKYKGVNEFILEERVFQYKDFKNIDNVINLKQVIDDRYKEPRYHIVRVPKKGNSKEKIIYNLKITFGEECEYIYDYLNKATDLNVVLEIKPTKHSFIFICEKARCAKTIHKKYIGVLYDRITNNDSVLIQSLAGRMCGYDDNNDSICYTNIKSLKKYIKFWDNDLSLDGIRWNSASTKYDKSNETTISKGTRNSPENIDAMDVFDEVDSISTQAQAEQPVLYRKGTKKDLISWWKENFFHRKQIKGSHNKDNKYLFDKRIVKENEIEQNISDNNLLQYITRQGHAHMDSRYLVPYYTNEGDLKWILIYKEVAR